jgi:RHH-type proline utilization regulon transcriptional repressor/proline dehydrogenase/delta 1-pyrroline-5-carboxylate dehydrogenase
MNAPDTPSSSTGSGSLPCSCFADGLLQRGQLRQAITAACRRPEPGLLPGLLAQARLSPAQRQATQQLAHRLTKQLRDEKSGAGRAGMVQDLLQEYALSSQEGVALMCLAEALLRIPDADTRNALIRDKISHGHWDAHLGHSPSLFVNVATWGLLLTGRMVGSHSNASLGASLGTLPYA